MNNKHYSNNKRSRWILTIRQYSANKAGRKEVLQKIYQLHGLQDIKPMIRWVLPGELTLAMNGTFGESSVTNVDQKAAEV